MTRIPLSDDVKYNPESGNVTVFMRTTTPVLHAVKTKVQKYFKEQGIKNMRLIHMATINNSCNAVVKLRAVRKSA